MGVIGLQQLNRLENITSIRCGVHRLFILLFDRMSGAEVVTCRLVNVYGYVYPVSGHLYYTAI